MRGAQRLLAACLGLTVGLFPGPSAAEGTDGVVSYRLDNGLTLVVAPRPDLRLAAVNLTVAFGAADDPPGRSGLAHLLEHVSLTGTAREGSLDLRAELAALERVDAAEREVEERREENGLDLATLGELRRRADETAAAARRLAEPGDVYGQRLEARGAIGLNAVTGSDATQFFCRIPSDQVGAWMALEADRLRRPLFRHFYAEREIVLREIGSLTGGRPTAQELFLAQALPGGPEGKPVFGRPDELRAIDRPVALALFRAAYRPERVVLVVVGHVDPHEMLALARQHFGDWTAPPAPVSTAGAVASAAGGPARAAAFDTGAEPLVLLGFPRPGLGVREAAALEALADLINSALLSPFHRALVTEEGMAWRVSARAAAPGERFSPFFLLQVHGLPGVAPARLEAAARELFSTLGEASEEDLTGALVASRVRQARALGDPLTLASQLAFHQVVYGDWRRLDAFRSALQELTPWDLRQAARRFLEPSGSGAGAPAEVGSRFALANGLRVWVAPPGGAVGLAEIVLAVAAGTAEEEPGERGAAWVTAHALVAGGARNALAREGVSLEVEVERGMAQLSLTGPGDRVVPMLRALAGLVDRAELPAGDWSAAEAAWRRELAREGADPQVQVDRRLTRLAWGEGVEEPSSGPLQRLAAFRNRVWAAPRMALAVHGALPAGAVEAEIRRAFSGLPSGGAPAAAGAARAAGLAGGVVECRRASGLESSLLLVGRGVAIRDDAGFFGWQVLAHILGGGHSSRLVRRLRLEEPLAYTVDTDWLTAGPGRMTLRVSTQTDDVERSRAVILEEMTGLAEREVTPQELATAVAIVRSRVLLDRESPRGELARWARRQVAPGPGLDLAAAGAVLDAMTPAGLLALARRDARPEVTVILGDPVPPLCFVGAAAVAEGGSR
jgi:predicted Zn-dependent peptidase